MTYQCRFFNCNKCTIMIGDVGDEVGSTCVGTGCIWKTSVPFSKFWFEPITALKIYLNKKKLKSEREKIQIKLKGFSRPEQGYILVIWFLLINK